MGQKKVKVRVFFDLELEYPEDWDKSMVEFHLNDSSWCCSNIIEELEKIDKKNGCICGITEFRVLEDDESRSGEENK